MKKNLSFLVLVLITSCSSNVTSISEHDVYNYLFTNINTPLEIGDFTASNDNIYFLNNGIIYAVDLQQKAAFEIEVLNIVDDSAYKSNNYNNLEYYKYVDLVYDNFLQHYDGHLYYVSEYLNIEGENTLKLYQLDLFGQNRKEIFTFDSHPYDFMIFKGHIFYRTINDNQVKITNLNTKETKTLQHEKNLTFLSYVFSESQIGFNLINDSNGKISYGIYDFEDNKVTITALNDFPFDKTKYEEYMSTFVPSESGFDAVILEGSEAVLNLGNVVINYMSNQYIYTSQPDDPQQFTIYDYQGKIIKTLSLNGDFSKSELFMGYKENMSVSRIIGIFEDQLLILGNNTDDGLELHLIDFNTEVQTKIFDYDN